HAVPRRDEERSDTDGSNGQFGEARVRFVPVRAIEGSQDSGGRGSRLAPAEHDESVSGEIDARRVQPEVSRDLRPTEPVRRSHEDAVPIDEDVPVACGDLLDVSVDAVVMP